MAYLLTVGDGPDPLRGEIYQGNIVGARKRARTIVEEAGGSAKVIIWKGLNMVDIVRGAANSDAWKTRVDQYIAGRYDLDAHLEGSVKLWSEGERTLFCVPEGNHYVNLCVRDRDTTEPVAQKSLSGHHGWAIFVQTGFGKDVVDYLQEQEDV